MFKPSLLLLGLLFSTTSFASYSPVETFSLNEIDWAAGSANALVQFVNIFGENERTLIDPENSIGNRVKNKIGKLIMPDGGKCTASLVWKNLILTASHCIANKDKTDIEKGEYRFCINYHNGNCEAESDVEWASYGSLKPDDEGRQYDWAILRLTKTLGEEYGYFGWRTPHGYETVSHAGFGSEFFEGKQLSIISSCNFRGKYMYDSLIHHDCDTSRGDSGAPIFICTDKDCKIVGLAAAENRSGGETTLYKPDYTREFTNIAVSPVQFHSKLLQLRKENP